MVLLSVLSYASFSIISDKYMRERVKKMLIRIKSYLESTKKYVNEGVPLSELGVKGTLAVICRPKGCEDGQVPDFSVIDGYIQFMHVVLKYCIGYYGEPDQEWKKYVDRIIRMGNQLQDKYTRFTGTTRDDFLEYVHRISSVFDRNPDELPRLSVDIMASEDITPYMEKCVSAKNDIGFWYGSDMDGCDDSNIGHLLADDIMKQLSNIKMEKGYKEPDISYYLISKTGKGGLYYHEHVFDAVNLLIQTAVYMINCSSTKSRKACSFDIIEIDNRLRTIESIMERAAVIV